MIHEGSIGPMKGLPSLHILNLAGSKKHRQEEQDGQKNLSSGLR